MKSILFLLLLIALACSLQEGFTNWTGDVGPPASGYGGTLLDVNPKYFDYSFMKKYKN